jgi:hypothetical protein
MAVMCRHCNGELYVDPRTVRDYAACGFLGGRFYCVAGCTSFYLSRAIPRVERQDTEPERAKGHPVRKIRHLVCVVCHMGFETRGGNARRCSACRREYRTAQSRKWWSTHRRDGSLKTA